MKAFKLIWPNGKRGGFADLDANLRLPRVHCDLCNQTWGNGLFQYPAIKPEFFGEGLSELRSAVSVPRFRELALQLKKRINREIELVPGASVGELTGTESQKRLPEFIWGTLCYPQISRSANALLAKDRILLFTVEMEVTYREVQKVNSHLALEIEPVAMMTEQSLKMHSICYCSRCGNYFHQKRNAVVSGGYALVASRWPTGQHLVMMRETLDILVSAEFMAAARRENMAGIQFQECGTYR